MTIKKKSPKHTVTITKEQTQSVTGSLTESITATDLSSEGAFSIEKLLGKDFEAQPENEGFLIRIHNNSFLGKICQRIGIEDRPTEVLFHNSVVIGPVDEADVQKLIQSKLLSRNDSIYQFQDRWKGVMDVFQDIKFEDLRKEEITETFTETAQGTQTESDITLQEDEIDRRNKAGQEAIGELKKKIYQEAAQEKQAVFSAQKKATSQKPRSTYALPAILSFVVLAGAAYYFYQSKNDHKTYSAFEEGQENPLRKNMEDSWPQELRPRTLSALEKVDDAIVAKIKPILDSYENGAFTGSEESLQLLKSFASPATASQEARKLSANQLAAFYLSDEKVKDSLNAIKPVIQSNQTDLTTIINLALTFLMNKDFPEARELVASALRLCPKGTCWIPYTVMGWVQGLDGQWGDSELNFQTALAESSQNPIIYGIWLRTLSPERPKKLLSIFRRAMWSDFDLVVDLPIRAPMASAVFLREASLGFQNASRAYRGELNTGQKAFLAWFLAKMESSPLQGTSADVVKALQKENDPQSKVFLAYIHKEEGRYNLASEILTNVLDRIEPRVSNVSWPWTMSADIQLLRGVVDRASLHYQAALSRNSRDMSALYGLGLILRENQDFQGAKQKIDEVVLAYPGFLPAQLRIHRYKWQSSRR